MMRLLVKSSRGQLKIQQMAFVLVAMMIFFSMVALFYFSIKISSLKSAAQDIREDQTKELVRKIADSPEFSSMVCSGCVDFDKLLVLKGRKDYSGFWKVAFLQIENLQQAGKEECTAQNYPDCETITLVDSKTNFIAHSSFVALCRYEPREKYTKCELGKVILGFETVS